MKTWVIRVAAGKTATSICVRTPPEPDKIMLSLQREVPLPGSCTARPGSKLTRTSVLQQRPWIPIFSALCSRVSRAAASAVKLRW